LDGLSDAQRGVRDRFQEGGSVAVVLLVLLALVVVVFGVYCLTLRQDKADLAVQRADPQKLFRDLLHRLDLAPSQRRLLGAVAKDLRLEQPSVILLSPVLFDRYVRKWQTGRYREVGNRGDLSQSELVAQTCDVLFPPT
jgi:hypothetical protein